MHYALTLFIAILGAFIALWGSLWLIPLRSYRTRFVRNGGLGVIMLIGGLLCMASSMFILAN